MTGAVDVRRSCPCPPLRGGDSGHGAAGTRSDTIRTPAGHVGTRSGHEEPGTRSGHGSGHDQRHLERGRDRTHLPARNADCDCGSDLCAWCALKDAPGSGVTLIGPTAGCGPATTCEDSRAVSLPTATWPDRSAGARPSSTPIRALTRDGSAQASAATPSPRRGVWVDRFASPVGSAAAALGGASVGRPGRRRAAGFLCAPRWNASETPRNCVGATVARSSEATMTFDAICCGCGRHVRRLFAPVARLCSRCVAAAVSGAIALPTDREGGDGSGGAP